MPLDYDRYDVLTFDCYGTLIDWEAGLIAALREALPPAASIGDDALLETFARYESAAQQPYQPYRDVLADSLRAVADEARDRRVRGRRRPLRGQRARLAAVSRFGGCPGAARQTVPAGRDPAVATRTSSPPRTSALASRSTGSSPRRWPAATNPTTTISCVRSPPCPCRAREFCTSPRACSTTMFRPRISASTTGPDRPPPRPRRVPRHAGGDGDAGRAVHQHARLRRPGCSRWRLTTPIVNHPVRPATTLLSSRQHGGTKCAMPDGITPHWARIQVATSR